MQNRNEILQSYRGILAFVVFLGHTLACYKSVSFELLSSTPFHIFFDGQVAVMCFFVLSGFFMKYEEWHITSYCRRIFRRLTRLLPAYILTTVAAYIIYKLTWSIEGEFIWLSEWGNHLWGHKYEMTDLVRNIFFISTSQHTWINPAAWYMQMDVEMMLIMPFVLGLAYRYNRCFLLIALPLSLEGHLYPIIAVTMGVFVQKLHNQLQINKRSLAILLIIGVICLDIRNIWLNYNPNITLYLQSLGAGIVLFCILKSDFNLLKNKYLVWFGNYSYEFYLIHMVAMLGLRGLGIDHFSFILLVFVITLLSSILLHKLSAAIPNIVRSA